VRIRRNSGAPSLGLIDITPLVDIMFTLIIFFLATTTFEREELDLKVNLPEAAKDATLGEAPKALVINVREDGSYHMSNRQMTLADLQQAIAAARKEQLSTKVLVRGDQRALHGHVAAAVLAAKRAGISEANIGYQLPQ
jgi:biopolymer transport protein ExbD